MGKSRKDYEKFLNSISPDRDDLALDVTGHRWAFNRYENDMLTAGCHRIAYSEMESIAKQLGWV